MGQGVLVALCLLAAAVACAVGVMAWKRAGSRVSKLRHVLAAVGLLQRRSGPLLRQGASQFVRLRRYRREGRVKGAMP